MLVADPNVDYPAFFVRAKTKTEQRMFVACHAISWLKFQHKSRSSGAIMVDIDDTLIDGHETLHNGFQYMKEMYQQASVLFPLHVVTARPDEDHAEVMQMLAERGFSIPPDRLHMLPTKDYGKETSLVEDFKWRTCLEISRIHNGLVARFGDKLWDCAHLQALRKDLLHVPDRHCYIFRDPRMKGCVSYKLPGM